MLIFDKEAQQMEIKYLRAGFYGLFVRGRLWKMVETYLEGEQLWRRVMFLATIGYRWMSRVSKSIRLRVRRKCAAAR